jgi:LCP family protein required for cell wall assembly
VARGIRGAIRQYYLLMAAGDDERPERPEYNVYRSGSGRGRGGKGRDSKTDKARGSKPRRSPEASGTAGKGPPGYSVYRSRRNPLSKLRGADLGAARAKWEERRRSGRRKEVERDRAGVEEKPLWRRVLRWALIGAAAWFLLSVVLFAVSAQIQKGKLNDQAAEMLGGNPLMVAFPQTILVIGTDARPEGSDEGGAETKPRCLKGAAEGDPPAADCQPFRADTLMLVRAGGGASEKLSIPRDTYASIPGQSAQKINAGYAFGGAPLQIETVEEFLGIDVDHTVILDFEGFADFIDAIGGVEVNLRERVKSKISGGASNGGITLKLDRGENTLDGQQALALARTRSNARNPTEDDTDRAARQQLILRGIKDRLTSPWRAPINFIRGPWIAWNAPKAMVSDMGASALPQLAAATAIGGDSGTRVLKPSGAGPGGSLFVPLENCEKAVRKFLGEAGPREPACSPAG